MKLSGERTVGAPTGSAAGGGDGRRGGEAPTTLPVRNDEDLITVRHAVRAATVEVGFGLVDQTRVVTAASELARNAYIHGGGGTVTIEFPRQAGRKGIRLTVRDEGPGIPDVEAALADGFTTGAGLGHGLGGARRLMHEFEVHTETGKGTTISATRWTTQ
ncbi:anti-sigma regulatory factor [Streptomyces macrosporus]|uniref:ATP-binding protein n=1 Tax=Streptomyces macrosporus TaxID=44032 RepID=A0ABP5WR06_9ACTN